jgi:hypothetical protein
VNRAQRTLSACIVLACRVDCILLLCPKAPFILVREGACKLREISLKKAEVLCVWIKHILIVTLNFCVSFIVILTGFFILQTPILTPWLMEPGGSMPHSQQPSNNPYPEPNQTNSAHLSSRSILIFSFHLRLGLSKGLFPVGLPVKILKALLHALPISIS